MLLSYLFDPLHPEACVRAFRILTCTRSHCVFRIDALAYQQQSELGMPILPRSQCLIDNTKASQWAYLWATLALYLFSVFARIFYKTSAVSATGR